MVKRSPVIRGTFLVGRTVRRAFFFVFKMVLSAMSLLPFCRAINGGNAEQKMGFPFAQDL